MDWMVKGDFGIADLVDVAVERGEADAKMGRVGLAEFRDVIGDRAAGLREVFRMTGVQEPQQGRFRTGPGRGAGGRYFHRPQFCRAITGRATGSAPEFGGGSAAMRSGLWE